MPAFIRNKSDEARWSKAKAAASKSKKKEESSFTDQDWALTNHIYHQMTKNEEFEKKLQEVVEFSKSTKDEAILSEVIALLEKARRRASDEMPDEDEDPQDFSEDQGFREFDPDAEESEGDKWLNENDPERNQDDDEETEEEDPYYDEYGPEDDEEAHQEDPEVDEEEQPVESDEESDEPEAEAELPVSGAEEVRPEVSVPSVSSEEEPQEEVSSKGGRFPQPSKEDIIGMREYTRPWERRARDTQRLQAEAHKNPVLHHEGQIVEAHNASHKDRQAAYDKMTASPEYQNADPITQMEMDSKFHTDWHAQNPEYLSNAVSSHSEAHQRGRKAKDVHAAAKDEQIRHILSGGAQPETGMSAEEALQHIGGAKGEEGTEGSIGQDRAASFAAGNKDFIDQYAKNYAQKQKKPVSLEEMENYDEGSQKDIGRILGEHPNLKDPAKKAKVDQFFKQYHPLISMSASRVMNKLGLDPRKGDIDLGMLHEAGMHGLFQAINDYEHENPSKASFATHAGNKIRGLMQTALRNHDQIPAEIRQAAKKFHQGKAAPATPVAAPAQPEAPKPKVDLHQMWSSHPKGADMSDRLKRIETGRATQAIKKPPTGGQQ